MLQLVPLKRLRWQLSQNSPLKRQLIIFWAILKLFLLWLWDKVWRRNSLLDRQTRSRRLSQTLIDLGPTFIKIGQALSTRSDLLPPEYIIALAELQDKVPPFKSEDAIALIESQFDKPLFTLLREFDSIPLASASLGQVHKALLHSGEEVVIKVQRPGLQQLFDLDFQVLHRLIKFGNRFLPGFRKYKLEAVYQEFTALLYSEIDYIHEGKNAERFRNNFLEEPKILAPIVYWQYTTHKILALEYLPGIKIDNRQSLEACGIDPQEIIQLGITSFLKQLLLDGFFQTDPHPGNMAVTATGEIIFYDFGTMAEVVPLAKDQMIKMFFAVLRKDTEEVVDTLTYMGLVEPITDMTPVKRLVDFLLERFTERPIDIRELEEVRAEILIMFEKQPFRLPPQMTFVLKAVTTLDGIARALDPEYNLLAASQPFVRNLTVSSQGRGRMVQELLRQGKALIQFKLRSPQPRKKLVQELEARLEKQELELRLQAIESDRLMTKVQLTLMSVIYGGLVGFTVLAGAVLMVGEVIVGAIAIFFVSGIFLILLLHSLLQI